MSLRDKQELKKELMRIDGKGYKAYKDIQGDYDFSDFVLHIDNVQSDPFAPPSRIRVSVKQSRAGFKSDMFLSKVRKVALEDFLIRNLQKIAFRSFPKRSGQGKSAPIGIDSCGQEILERTAMQVGEQEVQARLSLSLPARGRTILGRQAMEILFQALPGICYDSLWLSSLDEKALYRHIQVSEDQEFLRNELKRKGLIAFVGNGAVLPRKSGVSDAPMQGEEMVSFLSPESMQVEVYLPNQGQVKGMGIPEGVNLIVGGGYHGKSTLLKALERGVYNHVPEDGRELVVTEESAVKIRAEDGRKISGVNISPFISNLPLGKQTFFFNTDNASGSTSQAANIMESLETGSKVLLLDEDTSATNFMIRDSRMQSLVHKENEPITPFIDQVRDLYSEKGVSTILVLGGSGDYFDVADKVIMLKDYLPQEVTAKAREIAAQEENRRKHEAKQSLSLNLKRVPQRHGFIYRERAKIKAKGRQAINVDKSTVELNFLEQLVDESQTRSIAEFFRLIPQKMQAKEQTLVDLVEEILKEVQEKGLDILSPFQGKHPGYLALPRKQEICASINRYRRLEIKKF